MEDHIYYVYIVTNPSKKSLYIGVTNNLQERLYEHYSNRGNKNSWLVNTTAINSSITKFSSTLTKPLRARSNSNDGVESKRNF